MATKKPSSIVGKSAGLAKSASAATKTRDLTAAVAEPAVEPPSESFEEIAARVEERETAASPARRVAQAKHEQEVFGAAATVTAETAVRAIGDLKVTVDGTLDQLSQQLVEQAKKLAAVQDAVGINHRQLKELYDIEVVAETLAALVREHEQKQQQFAEDMVARKAALEREMQDARAAWDKEKQRSQDELAAEKARAKKEWQREQEEYAYTLKTRRVREEEEYQQRRQALEADLADMRAKQEKAIGEREAAVAAREKEFTDLQARVQGMEAELQRAMAQAREEATRAAEERARQVAALKAKDFEGTEKLLQQRIQTLDALIAEKNVRIDALQAELSEATIKVRDIAVKAIEGASGAAALTHVSGIALQQAKGRDDRS